MVRSEIKLALQTPFLWYEEYFYQGYDPENFHIHTFWQMTVVLDGELSYTFPDHGHHFLRKGNIILIAPQTIHMGHCSGKNAHSMQIFFRYFDPKLMPELSRIISPYLLFQSSNDWKDTEPFLPIARKIRTFCRESQELFRSWQLSLMLQLILEGLSPMLDQFQKDRLPTEQISPGFNEALVFIHLNFQKNIGIQDLADIAGLSSSHFAAIFKKIVGIPPVQFINNLRVSRAQELLLNHRPLSEVARLSGFHSMQYFCRYFKQRVGKTPLEFLKSPRYSHNQVK